jgi:hypothetical protein
MINRGGTLSSHARQWAGQFGSMGLARASTVRPLEMAAAMPLWTVLPCSS